MADCHRNFFTIMGSFHSKVALSEQKEESLRKSARELRNHIKKVFADKKRPSIKFQIQGSMAMKTAVNPLNDDYDIDDGLYFIPQLKERPTPNTAHAWVIEAAASYKTVDPPIDKKRCVRVPFKAGYHIDIPIYDLVSDANNDGNAPYLAIKDEGWIYSDPRAFTNWFNERVNETDPQMRRLVRYFKAWADYQNQKNQTKMPSGLILTILTGEEYQNSKRDDESFASTARVIWERLKKNGKISNPVDPSEDLRRRLTDPQFNHFVNKLEELVSEAEAALNHESAEEAAKNHWQKVLGERFPVIKDEPSSKKSKTVSATSGGLITTGSKSAY